MARFNNTYNQNSDKIWNMDQLFTERIDRRLDELDIATTNSNQIIRYRILHTIFLGTHFKFMDHLNELQKDFEDIKNTLNTQGNSQQHKNIVFSKAEKDIDKLSLKLIHLLYLNDLIGLKKKEQKRTGVTFEWIDD